jgi:glutamyl-tRNA synthetase
VDDAASGITHVLRGDDLLTSTARQLQLYEALEFTPPAWAHVPLLIGPDGKRMAKREGPSTVSELRDRGVPAESVIGLLASWAGLGDGAAVRARDLVEGFAVEKLPKQPVVVTENQIRERLGV